MNRHTEYDPHSTKAVQEIDELYSFVNVMPLDEQQPHNPPAAPPQRPDAPERPAKSLRVKREVHKPGEVNISAYLPAEMKRALRQVQAKTDMNVKDCLAEALQLLFRKYNVPVPGVVKEDEKQESQSLNLLNVADDGASERTKASEQQRQSGKGVC